jgi:hypothetical protein
MEVGSKMGSRRPSTIAGSFMYLKNHVPVKTNERKLKTNDGKTLFDDSTASSPTPRISFGCPVKVTLPAEHLKELCDRVAMGYFLGFKYEGAYKVWISRIGIQEGRSPGANNPRRSLRGQHG